MWRFHLDIGEERRSLWGWQFDIEEKLMLGQYTNRSELQRKLLLLERAEYNMRAAKSKYEEDLQDTMDDSFHGYQQEGFVISDDIVYENIFGIIGATSELQYSVDYAGSYTLELKDLREKRFMDRGYNSNIMQVIYDVMVKKPNNDFYETIAVYDEVVIPVGYE